MKLTTVHTQTVRVSALVAGLCLAISAKATVPVTSLPDFDNLPNFAQLGGGLLTEHNVTINGNVGVSSGGRINQMAPGRIFGNLYLAPGATRTGTAGPVSGTIFSNVDLSIEQDTVFSASAAFSQLPADDTYTANPTGPLNINVPAGEVYVINLNGGLSRAVTLTGDGSLVLNVMGSLDLSSGVIGNPSNIFINYLGTGNVGASGGPTINGQVFIPFGSANWSGQTLNGSLFSGAGNVTLMSAGTINAVPVPEPGTMALAAMGGISMIILRRRRCAP